MAHRSASQPAPRRVRWCLIALVVAAASVVVTGSEPHRVDTRILIPLGWSAVAGPNAYEVSIEGQAWTGPVVDDGYGGYWLDVTAVASDAPSVVLRIIVAKMPSTYSHTDASHVDWLSPSALIDSTDPRVIAVAERVTPENSTAASAALSIHDYLASTLTWRREPGHQSQPASTTLALGRGTCGNFARAFVALARAVGVPARTVQGVIYDDANDDSYHQWAEYRDENGTWHLVDPTTATDFDATSRAYIDLIYAAEENPLWSEPNTTIVADTTHRAHDGRLGFRLLSETPTSYTVENTYHLAAAETAR